MIDLQHNTTIEIPYPEKMLLYNIRYQYVPPKSSKMYFVINKKIYIFDANTYKFNKILSIDDIISLDLTEIKEMRQSSTTT
jgi:hypothetical protein